MALEERRGGIQETLHWIVICIIGSILMVNILQYGVLPAIQQGNVPLLSTAIVGTIAGAGILLFFTYIFL
jgi:hypothetical protein